MAMALPPVRGNMGDLPDLVYCNNCLDPSPLHRCSNGHYICDICIKKVKQCYVCDVDLPGSNFTKNGLARPLSLKYACPHKKAGCVEIISATDLEIHIKSCYHR
ncbi:E3 ubiquitin-protein ligase sina [Folsomia candida]|uniref:E3 ubiquitin-protein ligase sina n=2 Tax=Folsomia candida TaxID=158441 RepID=A0A226D249_FOLCA|nr:E3 ubiquitin-protein ligase sina [Folsomia candida]